MSTVHEFTFTMEQLFSDLEKDELAAEAETITKAKNGDSDAIKHIGFRYDIKKQQYNKAMAWYRLAAVKNNPSAQNNIGALYDNGEGVPQDYSLAMEWYLKAATQNNKTAWGNIGSLFENGQGIPVNKYKALEWYENCANKQSNVRALMKKGVQLTEQDKNKPIEQLIIETEDLVSAVKKKTMEELKVKTQNLKAKNILMQKLINEKDSKINLLEETMQNYRLAADKTVKELKARMDEEYTAKIKTFEKEKQQEIEKPVAQINKRDDELMEKNKIIQQPKAKTEEESSTKIKLLKEETNTCRYSMVCRQKEMSDQRETIEKMSSEIQSLKTMNSNQTMQLELQSSSLKTLEKVIASLCSVFEKPFEETTKKLVELEISNQNLEELFEQERRLKDKDIMLLKQNTQALLSKDKKEERDLELW